MRFLASRHPGMAWLHEDIAAEATGIALAKDAAKPDSFAIACAERIVKREARRARREATAQPRSHKRGKRITDEEELRARVRGHCADKWLALVGTPWGQQQIDDTRERVGWILSDALDVQAARAFFASYGAMLARLLEPGYQGSQVRTWMQSEARRIGDMHWPPMPQNAGRSVDERAAFVEFIDGSSYFVAGLDRSAKPVELAWLYFLCGYWEPLKPSQLRTGLTPGEVVRLETRRMADARKRHGEPERVRRVREYGEFVLRCLARRPLP